MEAGEVRPSSVGQTGAPSRARRSSAVRSSLLRLWPGRVRQVDPLAEGAPDVVVLQRDALYRRLLAVADVISVAVAMVVSIVLLGGHGLSLPALALAPLVLFAIKVLGLYDRDHHVLNKSTLDEAPRLFQFVTLFSLVLWLAAPLCVDGDLGREQVALLWLLLCVLMVLTRATVRRLAGLVAPPERCLVIAGGADVGHVAMKMASTATVKVEVLGRMALVEDDGEASTVAGVGDLSLPNLGTLAQLPEVIQEQAIDRLVIAPGDQESDALLELIRAAKALGVKVSIVPRLFEVIGSSVSFDDVDGLTLLGIRAYGLSWSSALIKRGFDCTVAGLLLAILAPFFAVAALAVKLSSRGPVFFRQWRIGQRDREFSMLKFRTMVEGADDLKPSLRTLNETQGLFKIADDPRITPVGRLLRRTSMDELPQLVNVLRGEMSLVGPRPLIPEEDAMIWGSHRRRLHVPPGMTGQWQILGSARIPLDEMVKIDYLYGANWSLWGDVKILLRTAAVVAGRRGL